MPRNTYVLQICGRTEALCIRASASPGCTKRDQIGSFTPFYLFMGVNIYIKALIRGHHCVTYTQSPSDLQIFVIKLAYRWFSCNSNPIPNSRQRRLLDHPSSSSRAMFTTKNNRKQSTPLSLVPRNHLSLPYNHLYPHVWPSFPRPSRAPPPKQSTLRTLTYLKMSIPNRRPPKK